MPDICTNPLLKGRNKKVYIINQHLGSSIPTDGLIGEWLFSGNANDTSGYGNNGTVTGALLSTNRKGTPNSCYGFGSSQGTNTSDNINLGSSAPLINIPSSDFSLSFWMWDNWKNVTNLGTIWSSYPNGILIRTIGTTISPLRALRFEVFFSTTGMLLESTQVIPSQTWVHACVTFDSATRTGKIYLNGVEMSYVTTTAGVGTLKSDSVTPKLIGKLSTSISLQTWYGYLDDIRPYNRILSYNEIMALSNE